MATIKKQRLKVNGRSMKCPKCKGTGTIRIDQPKKDIIIKKCNRCSGCGIL